MSSRVSQRQSRHLLYLLNAATKSPCERPTTDVCQMAFQLFMLQSLASTGLNLCQRNLILQWVVTNAETHNYSILTGASISHLRFREHYEKVSRNNLGAQGWEGCCEMLSSEHDMGIALMISSICGYMYKTHTRLDSSTLQHRWEKGSLDPHPQLRRYQQLRTTRWDGIIFFCVVAMVSCSYSIK